MIIRILFLKSLFLSNYYLNRSEINFKFNDDFNNNVSMKN